MPKFRKQPVVIEAVRITRPIKIETLEGIHEGGVGDWLITGVKGEQYPCKDDIFRATYEVVEEDPTSMNAWNAPDPIAPNTV